MKKIITVLVLCFLGNLGLLAQCSMVSDGKITYTVAPDGATVQFEGTFLTCASNVTISWEFGDGGFQESANLYKPEHIYSEEGSYIVTMTIKQPSPCSSYTFMQTVNISFASSQSIYADITGPTIAAQCQELTYTVSVIGGVPPYRYDWDMGSVYCPDKTTCPIGFCDPDHDCPASSNNCCTIQNGGASRTATFGPTGLGSNHITVTVTDAIGQYHIVSIDTKIKPDAFPLEYFVNGTSCGAGQYLLNSIMTFSPDVNPMSAFSPPIKYTWVFTAPNGTTTVIEDDSYGTWGFIEHTFTVSGVHQVSLTVADENGSMQANGALTICGAPPAGGNPNCNIDDVFKTIQYPASSLFFQVFNYNTAQASCNVSDVDFIYRFKFPNCDYPSFDIFSEPSTLNFSLDGSTWQNKTNGNRPWGNLYTSVFVVKDGATNISNSCCTVPDTKNYYIKPEPLKVERIELTGSCQNYIVTAVTSGGGWKWENGVKKYKDDYTWKSYDTSTGQELTDIFLNIPGDPPNGMRKRLNPNFFKNFDVNQYVELYVEVTVRDFAGQQAKLKEMIVLNPFRMQLKDKYYRCPGATVTFDNEFLVASGGTETYTYQWSGGLTGESPTFTAPINGSATYSVTITDDGTCSLTASTTVTARAMNTIPPANVKSCQPNGERSIGPNLADLGGSGEFSYDWSATTSAHLNLLYKRKSLNPIVKGLVGTAVYTLTITDLYGGCTKTAVVTVVSYPNTVNLSLPSTYSTCHGDELKLQVGLLSFPKGLPSGYTASWTYPTFPVSAPMQSTLNGGLIITGIAAHNVGLFPFKVRVTEAETGCYADATTNVRIQDSWRYTGYNSVVKTAVLGTGVPLWDNSGGGNNPTTNKILTPTLNNPTIEWSGATPTGITLFNSTPSIGTFIPTEQNPYKVMKVTDQTSGCKSEFRSIRYIMLSKPAEITATISNYELCEGTGDICVLIRFDPHILGVPTTYMPSKVKVNSNFTGQTSGLFGEKELFLKNSSGVYERTICVPNNLASGVYSLNINLIPDGVFSTPFVSSITTKLIFRIAPANQYFLTPKDMVICDFLPNTSHLHNKNSIIVPRCSPPFSNFFTGNGHTYSTNGRVYAKTFIELVNDYEVSFVELPSSVNNEGIHFYISECISENLDDPTIEERDFVSEIINNRLDLSLNIVPTPFHAEVDVIFQFNELQEQSVDLEIYDITGHRITVLRKWESLKSGIYNEKVDMGQYAPGIYTFCIRLSNGKLISKRSIKI